MPAPYDYSSASGYSRARADWIAFPDTSTKIRQEDLDKIEQALYDAKRAIFNVKDYGAKGDGTTNDAVAIQNAHDAAAAVDGTLIFPDGGTYILNAYITLGSGARILGNGATLKLGSGFSAGAQGQGFFVGTSLSDVVLDGLRFDGNGAVLGPHATNNFVVWFQACTRCEVRNCYATNVNSGGSNANSCFIWAGASHWGRAVNNRIHDVEGGAIFFQGASCAAVGNDLFDLNDVGIVFNSTTCIRGLAVGNVIDLIPAQAGFGVENGAASWSITGNTISRCFTALDVNDAAYAGAIVPGGVFSGNYALDLDKGASAQTFTLGVLIRGQKYKDILISNNQFSGLVPYDVTPLDCFVYIQGNSEGLRIVDNVFESKAQAVMGVIFFSTSSTHTRSTIRGNSFRSTSAVTKLVRGIWVRASCVITEGWIADNYFENLTNEAVFFDTSATFTGALKDNRCDGSAAHLYEGSPWGTFTANGAVIPHMLANSALIPDRAVWWASAAPTTGTWSVGDQVWNFSPATNGIAGWICTTAGTPGTWEELSRLDVKLRRSAATTLTTDDALIVNQSSGVIVVAGSAGALREFALVADANPRMRLDSDSLEFGAGGGSATDVVVARVGADRLALGTGDALELGTATSGGGQFVQLFEQTADAAAGAVNTARLYARDNGAGKTQLVVRFNTGAIQVLATEP